MKNIVEYLNPEGLAPAQGLYSHMGVIHGGKPCYVAGQLSVGDDGEVVGVDDFDAQFTRVFLNLKTTLEAAGGGTRSIAKMTTYLTSAHFIPHFMRLRAALFPSMFAGSVFPPNTLLIVSRLVKPEFMIEVEAIAALEVDRS